MIFNKACEDFYHKKTNDRLKKFYEKTAIKDSEHIINGVEVPSQEELFKLIDWKSVLEEVKKTSCEVFALEHDDPKDYKDYTIKSLNYLETIE